ncbi:hypothetical protein C7H19_21360 [Aphanothece hegewaldii CCALA 016]|uniref:tRNA nuclease CdiA C-terminal domain-containing protein n=1 Tax=Aphanothece hegewaldii CCALA 016 TaxID=2107694 RepID=A0A2T1LSE0_9CHRO|nr:hypothetical protein [Aphanothece hegewaldii]PSF32674.1 hypothetical protein C7H19_21360 [Aphanothece hegewaldii CCALA 016]
MNFDYIQQSREIYEQATSDYERYYFDENTGGFILIHQEHNKSTSNVQIATVLARLGNRVKLLSEQATTSVKTPDAEINHEIYEFKELTEESRSLSNRVQEGIGQAKKQGATAVIYYINRSTYDIWQINRGIRQAFFWDKNQQIQKISLLLPTGELKTIFREDWENGEYF